MNFFDTVAGHRFTESTVPRMVDAIEELTKELKKANEPIETMAETLSTTKALYEALKSYATKNLNNNFLLRHFTCIWTTYCILKDYEVDTSAYDRDIHDLWNLVLHNENTPFKDFDDFDNFMCEDLV